MRLRALFALSVVPAALFSVAAGSADTCSVLDAGADGAADDIVVCEETHYLSCEDAIGGKVHDFFNVPTISLTTDAPTGSFTAGEGCGYPEDPIFSGTVQDTPFNMDFGGFATTNIDSMTVELHDLGPQENLVQAANGDLVELDVRISIDGVSPFGVEENESASGEFSTSPLTLTIPVTAEISSTGASTKYVFTVTNLGADLPQLLKAFDANGDGSGDMVFHNVLVTVEFPNTPYPLGALPTDNVLPVWGATEVPASITFNAEPTGSIVDATLHN